MLSMQKLVYLLAACPTALMAQTKAIDVQHSSITIHVAKAGFFSVAGHEHWVSAPISAGELNDSDAPHVEFKVEASRMEVKPDPKVDAGMQAEIQKDMQQKTLESAQYPEIAFRSTSANRQPDGQWKVEGNLTLHGVTKPLAVTVKRAGGAYVAHVVLKQTDFGIRPIAVVGGLVKVKNEVEIDFRIVPRSD